MNQPPQYIITTAQRSDPLKAGALGRPGGHWSGASLRQEVLEVHPNIQDVLATAQQASDLEPYFADWYQHHASQLKNAHNAFAKYLAKDWPKLIATVETLTTDVKWQPAPVTLALSSIYPSTFWGDSRTIDLYYDTTDFDRDLLHELVHLRTEDILGAQWFDQINLTGQQRAIFMELLAEIILSRSDNSIAQAARSPYPFFADFANEIKTLSAITDFPELAVATATAVQEKTAPSGS